MKHFEVLTGRVGKISEVVELNNGNCVVNFSMAETPRVKKGDDWEDGVTIWTELSIFGDEARNLVRSAKPGTFLLVVGTRSARTYTVKDTNEERTVQSLVVDEVAVLINKFTFVEKLGSVNYYKEGRGGETAPTQSAGTSYDQTTKPAAKVDKAPVEKDLFADTGSFSDDDDLFGDDDDLFDLG